MAGPKSLYLRLTTWILIAATTKWTIQKAAASSFCSTSVTVRHESVAPCREFMLKTMEGWILDKVASGFVNFTSKEINQILTTTVETQSNVQCTFERMMEEIQSNSCCPGWEGVSCDIAICIPLCGSNGYCVGPSMCECTAGYGGFTCEENLLAIEINSNFQYCYQSKDCYGPFLDLATGSQLMEKEVCCEGSGNSWGSENACFKCPEYKASLVMQVNNLPYRTCANFGDSHYRTFDGMGYQYGGSCYYNLASDTLKGWRIDMKVINCSSCLTCRKRLTIQAFIGEQEVVLEAGIAYVNGIPLDLAEGIAVQVAGMSIVRRGDFLMVETRGGDLKIKADDRSSVYVTVRKDSGFVTTGLCGNNNGNATDDYGNLPNEVVFGNSLMIPEADTICPTAGMVPEYCDTPEKLSTASQACYLLLSSMFTACQSQLPPYSWHRMCKNAYCMALTDEERAYVTCSMFEAYGRECAINGVYVAWRSSNFCPKNCTNGRVYLDNMPSCPRTCSALHYVLPDECYTNIVSGCDCPAGTFLQEGMCVTAQECKCYYNGQSYVNGQTTKMRCNTCTCKMGRWDCTRNKCSSTCSVLGVNNVQTFDGDEYSFSTGDSQCSFKLIEPSASVDPSDLHSSLSLTMFTGPCHSNLEAHCILSVELIVQGVVVTIIEKSVFINSQPQTLPYSSDIVYVKEATSNFILIQAFGVQILADSTQRIYISLTPYFESKVLGLCGYFNYRKDDDMLANGVPEPDTANFVYYYSDINCYTKQDYIPNDVPSNVITQARAACIHITDTSLFGDCFIYVDPLYYFLRCVEEVTSSPVGDTTGICTMTSAYARQCAMKGVIVDWIHNADFSTICSAISACQGGTVYIECASPCSGHCRDLTLGYDQCEEGCIPGCVCGSNMYLTDHGVDSICVLMANCTCYDSTTATVYGPGAILDKKCETCMCVNGRWDCTPVPGDCIKRLVCPQNLVYMERTRKCLESCDTYVTNSTCLRSSTYSGCLCNDGLIQSPNGSCVQPDQCPCSYAGDYYDPGSKIILSCTEYICQERRWETLMTTDCPSTCWTSGATHYKTFDGNTFSFEAAACDYTMVQSIDNSLEITVRNIPCYSSSLICTKSVTIKLNGISISLVRGKDIVIGNTSLTSGNEYFTKNLMLFNSGLWINVVAPDMGIGIQYDEGNSHLTVELQSLQGTLVFQRTRLYIHLGVQWSGRVTGLCSNYDGDKENDLISREGSASTLTDFFNSFRTPESCPVVTAISSTISSDLCMGNEIRRPWAEEQCAIIKNDTGIFGDCVQQTTDSVLNMYYTSCLSDACSCDRGGDCECLCTAIAHFAEYCSSQLGICIKWRSQRLCPIQCEFGLEYQACGKPCPQTCQNIGAEPQYYCKATYPVEGCFCPDEYVREGKGCIPADNCPCYKDGIQYMPGTTVIYNCKNCTCTSGQWSCINSTDCIPCTDTEFMCIETGDCISLNLTCDGHIHCPDGSDETNCTYTCPPIMYLCASTGECKPNATICDGEEDCADGSDEWNCVTTCSNEDFACESGRCIDGSYVCDGEFDCGPMDFSDEHNCVTTPCPTNETTWCEIDGDCIPATKLCDGHDDCGDGSDEVNCISATTVMSSAATQTTTVSSFATTTMSQTTTPTVTTNATAQYSTTTTATMTQYSTTSSGTTTLPTTILTTTGQICELTDIMQQPALIIGDNVNFIIHRQNHFPQTISATTEVLNILSSNPLVIQGPFTPGDTIDIEIHFSQPLFYVENVLVESGDVQHIDVYNETGRLVKSVPGQSQFTSIQTSEVMGLMIKIVFHAEQQNISIQLVILACIRELTSTQQVLTATVAPATVTAPGTTTITMTNTVVTTAAPTTAMYVPTTTIAPTTTAGTTLTPATTTQVLTTTRPPSTATVAATTMAASATAAPTTTTAAPTTTLAPTTAAPTITPQLLTTTVVPTTVTAPRPTTIHITTTTVTTTAAPTTATFVPTTTSAPTTTTEITLPLANTTQVMTTTGASSTATVMATTAETVTAPPTTTTEAPTATLVPTTTGLTSQVTTSTGGTTTMCYIREGMNRLNLLPSDWIHVQQQPYLPNSEKDKLRIDDNEHFITSDIRAIVFNLTRDGIEPIFIEMINITDYIKNIFSIQILYVEANGTSYSSITQFVRIFPECDFYF